MIYFTSDTHFYYSKSAGKVGTRNFETPEEKNAFLMECWNQTVKPEDEIYILGDVSNGSGAETNEILRQLHGRKYLIVGNNDRYLDDPEFDPGLYEWIKQYYELHEMGTKWVLFHYPIEAWSGYLKDRIHLHGHLHRPRAVYEPIRRYEVGVDAHDGCPVSMEEVWEVLQNLHNSNRRMNFD